VARVETIEEKGGVPIAPSAVARLVKTKRIRSLQGDDAALVRIVSPRFAEIVSRLAALTIDSTTMVRAFGWDPALVEP
jgi:hypothetical protein